MGRPRNITLSVPRELIEAIERMAADRGASVSAFMSEALARLADEDRRYSGARKRALSALAAPPSLGAGGRPSWSRDQLHERRLPPRVLDASNPSKLSYAPPGAH